MNKKIILSFTTGLMIACGNVGLYAAHAEDYAADNITISKQGDAVRFLTNSPDANNTAIELFYNRDEKSSPAGKQLKANTFYFTNHHYGNNYQFDGNVTVNGKFKGNLSTPSSSSAFCEAGQFVDDANYHYVCVAPNKWKRVALSSF